MNWLFSVHLLAVVEASAVVLCVVILLRQRRTPESAVAWLLAMIFMPFVAVPVFLVLGFRKRRARTLKISFADSDGKLPPKGAFDALMRQYGLPPARGGHSLSLHETPEEAKAALDAVIGSAEVALDATLFIVADDTEGRWFVERLTERARQGVAVRLLLDRLGTWYKPQASLDAFEAAGGKLLYSAPFLRAPSLGHFNLRNHRKLVSADTDRVWSGGRNVGSEYLRSRDGVVWTDLSFDLTGPSVAAFRDMFEADWIAAGGAAYEGRLDPPVPAEGGVAVQLIPSGPDLADDAFHDGLVDAIHRASDRVWIATPYFLPTEQLFQALSVSARRGCDIRICIPERSNHRVADFARGGYLRALEESGCRIFRYQAGMLHAKAGIIDAMGWTGSVNFDVRSMLLNFEAALVVYDTTDLDRWFDKILSASTEGTGRTSVAHRTVEGLIRLSAPLL